MTTEPTSQRARKIILPGLILLLGIGAFLLLINGKTAPQHQTPEFRGALVETIALQPRSVQIRVKATGTVVPEQEIALIPEVSGKVSWISQRLVAGGFFQRGDKLLEIEPADYLLAVERARAEVARAEVSLRTEQERGKNARLEWQRLAMPDKGQAGPLVTREIQLKQAQADLNAAQAGLKLAQLNLQRTSLRAPFNGRIRQETVDLGQYLRAGNSIGSYAGTDRAEILVPLPAADLSWLSIPSSSDQSGAEAQIRLPGDPEFRWQGRVVRNLGEVDPTSRMATLAVRIKDPYQLQAKHPGARLNHGQFVELNLLGKQLKQVMELPRRALRENNHLWLVGDDQRLQIVPVQVVRREPESLIVRVPATNATQLVLSPIPGAAEGLLLRSANR